MTHPTRHAFPFLAAAFALLSFASGCSGSFAQTAEYPHARDFTPPARERAAYQDHHQATQTPATARAFERAERSPAAPRFSLASAPREPSKGGMRGHVQGST